MSVTIGKWRRLQQVASPAKTFSIMAVDHRGPLRRSLEKDSAEQLPSTALSDLKADIVRALGPVASAVLLDPETGAGQCLAAAALPGDTALVVALDTGSTGDPMNKATSVVSGWSVEKTVRVGASAVKLLIYYHPAAADAAETEALVKQVGDSCAKHDIPFFLEPLSHALDEARSALPSNERREVVVETARRLVPLGVDVLKAEFPVDPVTELDEKVWRSACDDLTDACAVPWVLLSGGVTFDVYLRQVQIACDAGASGVMAGRAVWKEAVTLDVAARNHFLHGVARERMQRLRTVCDALGRPFDQFSGPPELADDWYAMY